MRHRLIVSVFASVTALGLLGGCSATPETAAPAKASASPSVSASPTVDVVRASVPVIGKPVSVSKKATAKFGAAGVTAGYKAITEFAAANAMNPKVLGIPLEEVTAADLGAPKSMMTPIAQAAWDRNAATPSDHTSSLNMSGIQTYGLTNNGAQVRTDVPQPPVTISKGTVTVGQNGHMLVRFDVALTVRITAPSNEFKKASFPRSVSYWLLKGSGSAKPWLVDDWEVKYGEVTTVADVR
jgi:hypothetical protein